MFESHSSQTPQPKVRDKYTAEEIAEAMTWIEKQKKECEALTARDFGLVDCSKMDDEQKIMWVILMLACRDKPVINGKRRQVLMHTAFL